MGTRAVAVTAAVLWLAAGGLAAHSAAAEGKRNPPAAAASDLSGGWQLDRQLSDDAHEKMHGAVQPPRRGGPGPGMGTPSGPGAGGGGRLGPPPGLDRGDDAADSLRPILDPAEELVVYQGQPEIVIEEKYLRRRTLHPDGRKYKADNGASEVKTEWKQGRLVVETRGFRGRRTTETWELSEGGRRLLSTVKVENGFGPAVVIKRVYDRAAESPPPPDQD